MSTNQIALLVFLIIVEFVSLFVSGALRSPGFKDRAGEIMEDESLSANEKLKELAAEYRRRISTPKGNWRIFFQIQFLFANVFIAILVGRAEVSEGWNQFTLITCTVAALGAIILDRTWEP